MFAKFRWHVSKTQPIFLFAKSFEAHDALEDVLALRKIIFESRLELSLKTIIENSGVVSAAHAGKDVKYLDHRHRCHLTI